MGLRGRRLRVCLVSVDEAKRFSEMLLPLHIPSRGVTEVPWSSIVKALWTSYIDNDEVYPRNLCFYTQCLIVVGRTKRELEMARQIFNDFLFGGRRRCRLFGLYRRRLVKDLDDFWFGNISF